MKIPRKKSMNKAILISKESMIEAGHVNIECSTKKNDLNKIRVRQSNAKILRKWGFCLLALVDIFKASAFPISKRIRRQPQISGNEKIFQDDDDYVDEKTADRHEGTTDYHPSYAVEKNVDDLSNRPVTYTSIKTVPTSRPTHPTTSSKLTQT